LSEVSYGLSLDWGKSPDWGRGDGWGSKKNENKFTLSYKSKNKIKSVNIKPIKLYIFRKLISFGNKKNFL